MKKICEDQDKFIKSLEKERSRLISKLDEISFENNNLISKLKGKEDNLLINNKQLDEARQNIIKLQVILNIYN